MWSSNFHSTFDVSFYRYPHQICRRLPFTWSSSTFDLERLNIAVERKSHSSRTLRFEVRKIVTKSIRIMTQPAKLPQDNSDLSSVISVGSNLNRYLEGRLVGEKLAVYGVASTTDRTPTILSAFANELPRDGASNLQQDILECSNDSTLRQLANHLVSAILIPCMYLSINFPTS